MSEWYKLDNAAKIYAPVMNRKWTPLFRMSVDLTEDVDPEILKEAQRVTLDRFPSFRTTLKAGFFWYYLDTIKGEPPLLEDVSNPCDVLHFKKNNHFMFRILYYKKRIAIEYFHSLADGTGAMTFLMTLVNEYLHLKYGIPIVKSQFIFDPEEAPDPEEYEDAFLRYCEKKTIGISEPPSYQFRTTPIPYNRMAIVTGIVETSELKELAARYNCKVGEFCSSLLLWCALQVWKQDPRRCKRKRMVKISVPVNLRRFFPSKTVRNFSSFVDPGLYGALGDYSLEECIQYCRNFVQMNTDPKLLKAKFSYNVAAEKNFFIRITPLFIKNPVLRLAYWYAGDLNYATTVSNLGQIDLPEPVSDYVTRVEFMLGRAKDKRTVLAVASYKGKTYFNFTRTMAEADLIRFYLTTLVKNGVNVFVESNGGVTIE